MKIIKSNSFDLHFIDFQDDFYSDQNMFYHTHMIVQIYHDDVLTRPTSVKYKGKGKALKRARSTLQYAYMPLQPRPKEIRCKSIPLGRGIDETVSLGRWWQ